MQAKKSGFHKFKQCVKYFFLALLFGTVIYIVAFDVGDSARHEYGAGHIWWGDVPLIDEIVEKIEKEKAEKTAD